MYPASVSVPVVSHASDSRPFQIGAFMYEESVKLPPLCPGSIATTIPARAPLVLVVEVLPIEEGVTGRPAVVNEVLDFGITTVGLGLDPTTTWVLSLLVTTSPIATPTMALATSRRETATFSRRRDPTWSAV